MKLILKYFTPAALGLLILTACGNPHSKEDKKMYEKFP